jgi:hypothetical protein
MRGEGRGFGGAVGLPRAQKGALVAPGKAGSVAVAYERPGLPGRAGCPCGTGIATIAALIEGPRPLPSLLKSGK